MKETILTVAEEVTTVLKNVNENEALQVSNLLQQGKRIFVLGEGRSGLMGKAFAMRLMHGGSQVYVVGETITPSIQEGDLLFAISGSGTTSSIVQFSEKAKSLGAEVIAITTDAKSPLAQITESVLTIPAATKYRKANEPKTIQPLGNQFDQSLHLLLDAIIIFTLKNNTKQDIFEEMKQRHNNLE